MSHTDNLILAESKPLVSVDQHSTQRVFVQIHNKAVLEETFLTVQGSSCRMIDVVRRKLYSLGFYMGSVGLPCPVT